MPFTTMGNPGRVSGSRMQLKDDSIFTVLRYLCNISIHRGIILYKRITHVSYFNHLVLLSIEFFFASGYLQLWRHTYICFTLLLGHFKHHIISMYVCIYLFKFYDQYRI